MRLIGLAMVAACRGEESGGDSGDEAAGGGGGSGSGLVWVDADGTEVPGVVSMWEGLAYVDGDGVFWRIDPFGDDEEALSGLVEQRRDLQFSDPECEEPLLPFPPAPRMTISVLDAFRVVPDDAEPVYMDPVYAGGSDCRDDGGSPSPAIPVADLIVVERPAVTWTPPLHPELR